MFCYAVVGLYLGLVMIVHNTCWSLSSPDISLVMIVHNTWHGDSLGEDKASICE